MLERIKGIAQAAGVLLLILSAAALIACAGQRAGLRPAEAYEDKGIYTFSPYRVLPHQEKNNSSGRTQRMNPTKTVYMVYYRAVNGAGYQWSRQVASKEAGYRAIEQGERVQRRVLSIPAEGTYITVDPKLSAEDYAGGLRRKYIWIMSASGAYLLAWPLGWALVLRAKRRKRRSDQWKDWEESHD